MLAICIIYITRPAISKGLKLPVVSGFCNNGFGIVE